MQRTKFNQHINLQPVECFLCKKQSPSYFHLITESKKPHCYQCIKGNDQLLKSVTVSYKDHCEDTFGLFPLPDLEFAEVCMKSLDETKNYALQIINQLKKNIEQFQLDILEFYTQAKIICEGYIEKIRALSEKTFTQILKGSFFPINQQKYARNIKEKQKVSSKIKQLLQQLKVKIPSVKQMTKNYQKQLKRYSICQVPIHSIIEIRGTLYFGTADGKIIFQDQGQWIIIKGHQSLIRSLAYDGQFTLFSGSDDFKIKAWDIRKKGQLKLLAEFGNLTQGGRSYHRDILVFNKGKTMASTRGIHDQFKIRLWQLKSYKNTKVLVGHQNYIRGMCMIHEEEIITASDDKSLRVWNTNSGKCDRVFYHSKKIQNVHGNKNKELVCIYDEDNRAIVLDHKRLKMLQGWSIGKKVTCSEGNERLYFGVSSQIFVFSWYGVKLFTHPLQVTFIPGNMLEVQNKLIVCDGKGRFLQIPFHEDT